MMSGAFVKEDDERAERLESQALQEKRTALLEMLVNKRKRVETDPKLSKLPAPKKREILSRIEREITELQELLSVPQN